MNDARALAVRFAALLLMALALAWAGVARADDGEEPTLPASEWKAIQRVIGSQLRALRAGDAPRAMSFASPAIRAQFGDAGNFLAMVRVGYEALLVARATHFLEGAVIEGSTIQPLQLTMPDNTVLIALYSMEKQKDGRWLIAGCVIAPSTLQAA